MATTETTVSRTSTLQGVKKAIKACLSSDQKHPIMLWGPPGIGKSEIVFQLAQEMNGKVWDLRLAQNDPTDIKGIPYYSKEDNKMRWADPDELPSEEEASQYDIGFLFLDEVNSAPAATQASAYQLVLNRRVGKHYKVPNNVYIIAAGNREGDRGVTYKMPSPLANRFIHLEVRPDYETWEQYAVKNRLHEDVVGYIGFAKQDLFDFDPKNASRAFATPRTWSFVSDILNGDNDEETLMDLIAGCVGEGIALKFNAHRKISSQLPKPIDILNGKVKTLETKEISAMYSLTISMCYELQDIYRKVDSDKKALDDWYKQSDNFFKFMMENFTTELVVMGARTALTTYELPFLPSKLKSFDEFHKRYGKYVVKTTEKK